MPKYAAFLRAVNLGPTRKTSSAELKSAFEGLGMVDVATFRTSGNVVFGTSRRSPAKLQAELEMGLEQAFGFDFDIFLRPDEELVALAEHQPFDPALVDASDGKLQVMLLSEPPARKTRDEVLAHATDADRLAFGERELFWLPSGRMLESELDLKAIGKLVGTNTMRTKGTIELIAEKFFAEG
ncbi:MAG: DUF1697 domain-containing protein [Thermoleophilaceae bacterium]